MSVGSRPTTPAFTPASATKLVWVFLWVGLFNLIVVAQFWSFANDIYTQEQGKRLFAIVGIGSSIGAIFGAILTMYTAVATRSREIATLRALGFNSLAVVTSVLAESLGGDVNLDSLGRVELQARLEQQFGVALDDSALQTVKTAEELRSLLSEGTKPTAESVADLESLWSHFERNTLSSER